MSELMIRISEDTDERFEAACAAALARGKALSCSFERRLRPKYLLFRLVGFTSHGGTATIVVDVDDGTEKESLFV